MEICYSFLTDKNWKDAKHPSTAEQKKTKLRAISVHRKLPTSKKELALKISNTIGELQPHYPE